MGLNKRGKKFLVYCELRILTFLLGGNQISLNTYIDENQTYKQYNCISRE